MLAATALFVLIVQHSPWSLVIWLSTLSLLLWQLTFFFLLVFHHLSVLLASHPRDFLSCLCSVMTPRLSLSVLPAASSWRPSLSLEKTTRPTQQRYDCECLRLRPRSSHRTTTVQCTDISALCCDWFIFNHRYKNIPQMSFDDTGREPEQAFRLNRDPRAELDYPTKWDAQL